MRSLFKLFSSSVPSELLWWIIGWPHAIDRGYSVLVAHSCLFLSVTIFDLIDDAEAERANSGAVLVYRLSLVPLNISTTSKESMGRF